MFRFLCGDRARKPYPSEQKTLKTTPTHRICSFHCYQRTTYSSFESSGSSKGKIIFHRCMQQVNNIGYANKKILVNHARTANPPDLFWKKCGTVSHSVQRCATVQILLNFGLKVTAYTRTHMCVGVTYPAMECRNWMAIYKVFLNILEALAIVFHLRLKEIARQVLTYRKASHDRQ